MQRGQWLAVHLPGQHSVRVERLGHRQAALVGDFLRVSDDLVRPMIRSLEHHLDRARSDLSQVEYIRQRHANPTPRCP